MVWACAAGAVGTAAVPRWSPPWLPPWLPLWCLAPCVGPGLPLPAVLGPGAEQGGACLPGRPCAGRRTAAKRGGPPGPPSELPRPPSARLGLLLTGAGAGLGPPGVSGAAGARGAVGGRSWPAWCLAGCQGCGWPAPCSGPGLLLLAVMGPGAELGAAQPAGRSGGAKRDAPRPPLEPSLQSAPRPGVLLAEAGAELGPPGEEGETAARGAAGSCA